jgi:hypothetical protein
MKMKLLLILLLLFSLSFAFGEKNRVLVFAFENRGGLDLEQYSELVPNSFYALLKDIPHYSSVPWAELKKYLETNNYKTGDLQNPDTLISIARAFKADDVIWGHYEEKSGLFVVSFEVIDVERKKVIYRSEKFGQGGIFVPDTLENVIAELVQDFTGLKIEFAYIDVKTDFECTLFIDEDNFGRTPVRKRLLTGKHEIKVSYKDESESGDVFKGEINLAKDEEKSFEIRVFVDIAVYAELACEVSINDKAAGTTPYRGRLLSGNEYFIKTEYVNEKGMRETVDGRVVSTMDEKNVAIDLKVTGRIDLISGAIPFKGGVAGVPFERLPYTFASLPLGLYRAQCFLEDPKNGDTYIFYDSEFYLHPGEQKSIDISGLEYDRGWEYLLVPSLPQFHNREPVKGSIVLAGFVLSLAAACVSFYFADSMYRNDYLPKADAFNKNPLSSGYTQEGLNSIYGNVMTLFGISIGSFVLAAGVYLYSIIDGKIIMDNLYDLCYTEK